MQATNLLCEVIGEVGGVGQERYGRGPATNASDYF